MTVNELHKITTALRAKKQGNIDVTINYATFCEHEDCTILFVDSAKVIRVQGVDDGGPVGRKEPFLVLDGGFRD